MDIGKLDKLYRDSESCDEKIFSEMRSNVLLVSGDHYNRRTSKYWDRIKSSKGIKDSAKLRLTKNHTQTIVNSIISRILSQAPNVSVSPNNMDEMQDQNGTASSSEARVPYFTMDLLAGGCVPWVREPQPHPSSRISIPSSSPARLQVSSSMADSASSSVVSGVGQ